MKVTDLFNEIHSLLDEQDPNTTDIEVNVGYGATNISVSPQRNGNAIRVEGWENHKRISLARSGS